MCKREREREREREKERKREREREKRELNEMREFDHSLNVPIFNICTCIFLLFGLALMIILFIETFYLR